MKQDVLVDNQDAIKGFIIPMRNWNTGALKGNNSMLEIYNTYEELKLAVAPIITAFCARIYNTYEELKLVWIWFSLMPRCLIYNTYEELKLELPFMMFPTGMPGIYNTYEELKR